MGGRSAIATFPLHLRHIAEYAMSAKIQRRLADQLYTDHPAKVTSSRPAGDERTLRGIPAIGRSVAGAIPGTNPDKISA